MFNSSKLIAKLFNENFQSKYICLRIFPSLFYALSKDDLVIALKNYYNAMRNELTFLEMMEDEIEFTFKYILSRKIDGVMVDHELVICALFVVMADWDSPDVKDAYQTFAQCGGAELTMARHMAKFCLSKTY